MASIAEQRQHILDLTKELRQKILLTEGEGKAFYEESEAEKQTNKAKIAELRATNRALRARIHEAVQGEERAVERVLFQEKRRHSSVSSRPSPVPLYPPSRLEEKLAALQAKIHPSGRNRLKEEQATIRALKEEHVALENELERMKAQLTEAQTVRRHYASMTSALRGEAALHNTSLDALNTRLADEKLALKKLRAGGKQDSCGGTCSISCQTAYDARRERERKINEYRQRAEERRVSQIAVGNLAGERRLSMLRSPQRRDSTDADADDQDDVCTDIDNELNKYLAIFSKMKMILGVSSVEAVIERMSGQSATQEHLQELREAALHELRAAEAQREELQQNLNKLKYAATEDNARLGVSSVEAVIERMSGQSATQEHLQELREAALHELRAAEAQREELQQNLNKLKYAATEDNARTRKEEEELKRAVADVEKKLVSAMASRDDALKHLVAANTALVQVAEKLEGLMGQKIARNPSPALQAATLIEFCSNGARNLLAKLPSPELDEKTITDEDEEEDSLSLPLENLRISLTMTNNTLQQSAPQQVEEESGDEEAVARRVLKRASQQVVEAKSRKRNKPVTTSFKS
ncbi:outer dynein arm-docking complex subunit 3-like [Hyalella azteca]|uniref:Outer dynein arm-docking complex subunit 3-like n=1 Tax=Hyalella azteca TaxID=294128 RepID=A0A979FWP1_HYAAZ|nr:outer dynein arm-docking complex subunit 3-like [Hyalella azteca]